MTGKDAIQGFSNSFGFGPSDRPDQRPLPLRIVCVADFRGAGHGDNPGLQAIDAHDFDAVMARTKPRAFFDAPGHLGGKTFAVDVTLLSIKDFEPARAASLMPALAPLRDFVARARELQSGALSPAAFKQDLSHFAALPVLAPMLDELLDLMGGKPAAPGMADNPAQDAPAAVDSAIASIFSMVDAGPAPAKSGGSAIDAAGAAIAGGGRFDLSGPIARAQKLLEAQLAEVVHHPRWRALEHAWRGLHLLCRNGKAATIDLLHAAKDETVEVLRTHVVEPDQQGRSAPVSLLLCDLELANTPADTGLLQQLGETGGQLMAPVVVALDAQFLGVESMAALAAMDNPAGLFSDSAFDAWRSLRDKECSRWLVAAVNGYSARAPFGAKHGLAEEATESGVLWASPVWLVGAAVARCQENTGWPSNHTGLADGEISGLAVFDIAGRDSQFPLQALFPEDAVRALARAGLTTLVGQPNHDSAWVVAAPVLRKPSRAEEEGKMNTLAYALLASRLGAAVGIAKARLAVVNDADRTRVNFEQYLEGLLSDTGPGAGAAVTIADGAIHLQLRVGRAVLGGVELNFSLPLS